MYVAFIFFVFLLLLFSALWRATIEEGREIRIFGYFLEVFVSSIIGILIIAYFLNKFLSLGDWLAGFGKDEIVAGNYTYGFMCVIIGLILKIVSSLDLD